MMSEEQRPLTKEEWIARMKEVGRDQLIKQEMIRLGFWIEKPLDPVEKEQIAQEEEERKQLRKELERLKRESERLPSIKEKLAEAREKRIEESKRRRAERKAQIEREREEAKKRWEQHLATHVVFAGEGVSAGLNNEEYDEDKLLKQGLPLVRSSLELAEKLGISLPCLKWLTYHRSAATLSHYARFTIPKKSGGLREISAPKPKLRQAQTWVKEAILDKIPLHDAAYGFVVGRSTVDNAKQHLNQKVVVKMDLEDFFPTIDFWRVRGVFQSFGYSEAISTLLALLTTEPPRTEVEFEGTSYYIALGKRHLPQGACTSPVLTNIICRRLDQRLSRFAQKLGFVYTRYADDLTFSGEEVGKIGYLMQKVRDIIENEGFQVNEKKTRVLRSSGRQRVTGIVVNEKPNLSRKELKKFRALLHNVEKNGLEKENRNNHPYFWDYLKGYVSYIQMVRPDLAIKFSEQLIRIAEKNRLPLSTPQGRVGHRT